MTKDQERSMNAHLAALSNLETAAKSAPSRIIMRQWRQAAEHSFGELMRAFGGF